MPDGLHWDRDGADWPHRAASRFVVAGGLRWHVQQMGEGPVVLLIHGTGASTHSWRGLLPLLARQASVVAMDLPGHGFTGMPPAGQLSLPGMSALVASLVDAMKLDVAQVVGHSAGAAIAVRQVLDGRIAPRSIVGINAALLPLGGLSGLLFPPVARIMASNGIAARLFAQRRWDRAAVERLIAGTGSRIDAQGLALYGRLLRDARHASGALGMMAGWDLAPLQRDLSRLRTPSTLIVGASDRAVPPGDAARARALMAPGSRSSIATLRGGHLVHEEEAAAVSDLVAAAMAGVVMASA